MAASARIGSGFRSSGWVCKNTANSESAVIKLSLDLNGATAMRKCAAVARGPTQTLNGEHIHTV